VNHFEPLYLDIICTHLAGPKNSNAKTDSPKIAPGDKRRKAPSLLNKPFRA